MGGTKLRWMICAAVCAMTTIVCGHDSPEHEIEALTRKMEAKGATAELLARRATEWRALRNYKEAAADLERAVRLKSNSVPLVVEYARVEMDRGNVCAAANVTDHGLKIARGGAERASLHMLRAEIAERRGLHAAALEECEKGLKAAEPQLEGYLMRTRLQQRLEKFTAAAQGLKEAYEKSGSVVLEIEWIEAMIDAGECDAALERIGKYAARARWKAAWLIREARAEQGLGRNVEEKLQRALKELEGRLEGGKADLSLMRDRAMANLLSGKRDEAARDLETIRTASGSDATQDAMVARLERMLKRWGV
jgi:tetratricopeptide (TPR) repeat protein